MLSSAHVVGSSRVFLDEMPCKEKQLNEDEIALRREETARKRKHPSIPMVGTESGR
ncbi:hypothetical protein BC827DRAFT_1171542 [Russula dissimulans]|nr:hypothetical protein BC827DRAFT_1171542 [Russula dissimulans]